MKNNSIIIGITGAFGSGKSTAAQFFAAKGYTQITLSSFLEAEAKKRGSEPITRKLLQDIGNELRVKEGKGILAKKALQFIEEQQLTKVIIDGIRNLGEVEALQKHGNFFLIGIIADRTVRFDRLQKNKRRELLDKDVFKQLDYRDLGIGETQDGLQVYYYLALADHFIDNNSTEQVFDEKLNDLLKKVEQSL